MADPDHRAEPLSTVLEQEMEVIRQRRMRKGFAVLKAAEGSGEPATSGAPGGPGAEARRRRAAYRHALDRHLVGLAFSGGGIRSATFNLGVLQALADLDLLKRFDYLSTVSGGGYIGSWLSALCHRWARDPEDRLAEVTRILATERAGTSLPKGSSPAPAETKEGGEPELQTDVETEGEPEAIRFLRRYSNYLTPSVGLLTADTWAVVTTYLRNLLLNLLVLASAFAAVLMVPRLLRFIPEKLYLGFSSGFSRSGASGETVALVLAGLLALTAVCFMGYNLGHACEEAQRRRRERLRRPEGVEPVESSKPFLLRRSGIQLTVVLPLLLAAFLGTLGIRKLPDPRFWVFASSMALAYTAAWIVAALFSRSVVRLSQEDARWGWQIFWAPLAGFFGGSLLLGVHSLLHGEGQGELDLWQALTLGPPLVLILFTFTAALHTGLVGRTFHDYFREWLSRVGAWLLIFGLAWAALFAVTVYGPPLVYWLSGGLRTAVTAGWVGTTLAGLLASRAGGGGRGKGALLRGLLAKVAPYIFIVGLLLWLAVGIDFALSLFPWTDAGVWRDFAAEGARTAHLSAERLADLVEGHAKVLHAADFLSVGALWLLLAVMAGVLSWRIDVNEFSMHRLYRNRLVRCYLGSTVDVREREALRNPFTGFNPEDDIPLSELRPTGERPDHTGPYHIINAALNLVGGSELAWQERKADSFVFTPLYCGYAPADSTSAYRTSSSFGNHPKKLTLGSALAISGAAASPNMGFRSSPPLAFLLAVFNVRLGWWLGNPRSEQGWSRSGPQLGLASLLREVLGMTSDLNRYVYLSDGGHFENLGIYELVRRRCRFILACDAGQDDRLAFDDLGNAIRKCRTDLDVEVEVRPEQIRIADPAGHSTWHCAVGALHYDRVTPDGGKGILLYLKPSLTGDEPEDLLNYAAQNPDFPHQSTADQWFGESQFESYRRLGHHVAMEALGAVVGQSRTRSGKLNFECFLQRLRERWYPPSGVAPASFSSHGATLEGLFERLRTSDHLAFLHSQFYPEWPSLHSGSPSGRAPIWLPAEPRERTDGFYFCNSLIQFMENVYLDLNLEETHAHPDNRGWINLFKHWSWSGMFRVTWAISAATYGNRFQSFCRHRLGLRVMDDLLPVSLHGADGPADRTSLAAALESTDLLNFHERNIIREILAHKANENRIDTIYALQVVVENPLDPKANSEAPSLTFGCGFALLDAGSLAGYRIQDHLRKMGLGREGILALAKRRRAQGDAWPPIPLRLARIPTTYAGEFPESDRLQFEDLVRSVERELSSRRG